MEIIKMGEFAYPHQISIGQYDHHYLESSAKRCHSIWDAANAQFSPCALPFLSAIPLVVIILVTLPLPLSHISRIRKWRPEWTKPFIRESKQHNSDLTVRQQNQTLFWSFSLLTWSTLAIAAQIIKLRLLESGLPAILLLIAWAILTSYIVAVRPRSCPTSLLTFYVAAIVPELAFASTWTYPFHLLEEAHMMAAGATSASIVVLMVMPFRSPMISAHGISPVGSVPNNEVRSPEDNLRLWQWLTVSWISPLIKIGYSRKLEETDVWLLPYSFQHTRLHAKFRLVKGSVTWRLLKANGLDCLILAVVSLISSLCDGVYPLILQQLLLAMERDVPARNVAMTYAVITLVTRMIDAQQSMLSFWYGRRCYERCRGELIMMVYEKALSRKVVIGLDKKKEGTSDDSNGEANGKPSEPAKPTWQERWPMLNLFLDLLWRKKDTSAKDGQPASTGKIFNIVRGDVYQVSQRFWEIDQLVKIPVGLVISIYLIWKLLGPSCFIGVVCVFAAQLINGGIVKIFTRWAKLKKAATDARLQANSQYIEVLRHLRWYGWHNQWLEKVMKARQHELYMRLALMGLNIGLYLVNVLSSLLFPVIAFLAYTKIAHKQLRIDIIFPALGLFEMLQRNLMEMPALAYTLLNAYVSMKRIDEFMQEPERSNPDESLLVRTSIKLDACSFSWPGATGSVLKKISLELDKGLTVIHGKVAAGKTALLQGILGELDLNSGTKDVPDEMMAYCSQTPWLQSMSIKDNILFMSPFEEERYHATLEACALLPDLENFKDGDRSLIGENGIGLSGGQKARVALARAVYSRAKILLLDDPLSALDHNTAEFIVDKLFAGPLMRERIVALVTHRTSLVRHLASNFVEVIDGEVHMSSPGTLPQSSSSSSDTEEVDEEVTKAEGKKDDDKEVTKFIEDEKREHGEVKWSVFWTYLKTGSVTLWICMALAIVFGRTVSILRTWYFKAWAEAYKQELSMSSFIVQPRAAFINELSEWAPFYSTNISASSILDPTKNLPNPADNPNPWILILFCLCMAQFAALLMFRIVQTVLVYLATKKLFARVMVKITNASFRFYDVTPVGRLMNRLTADMETVDNAMSYFQPLVFNSIIWISSLVVIAYVTPLFLLCTVLLMTAFVTIFMRFLATSQSLRRLETVSLSPLFANFGELLQGLTTVRAFHAQQQFQERIIRVVDNFQGMDHFYWSLQTWVMYRFETVSAVSTFAFTVIAIYGDLSAGLTAFMLSHASTFVQATHTLCRRYGSLQMDFVSVERVVELLDTEQEVSGTIMPPASWPAFGSGVSFDNVTIRYAPHLDPALQGITLRIPGGCTTAVVGRTGSGKSTLAAALLNIVRPDEGYITMDGISLTDVDTTTLRHRVTFVAQDPVLFSGTIRHNLDPVGDYTDEECAVVLKRICERQNWELTTNVESGGANLSQGQRQLIGITRAVLRRSPVIVLDEATASIDLETSMEIQAVLREEMKESTVITIAHRVEAVRGADWVVMLEGGRVVKEGKVDEVMSTV